MNKIYKLKFDRKLQQLIVVSELATGAGKEKTVGGALSGALHTSLQALKLLSSKLTPLALSLSLAALPAVSYAADLPTGGQIVGGTGQISSTGNQMTISQQSQNMAANWQSFDIGQNHSVQFVQPNSSAIALNRVTGQSASQIMGQLNANGKVFLINPNGVMVGKGAQVNTAGFLASTKNLSVNDFMQGNYALKGGSAANAEIINQGSLTTTKGGFIVLAADQVRNEGTISTPGGKTVLAAADQVTLTLDTSGLTGVSVSGNVVNALVENKGLISARDGKVYLTARGQDMLVKTVVNNTGIIDASSMTAENGVIRLGTNSSATTSALASNTNSNGATTSAVANNTSGNNASTGALANNTSGNSATTSAVASNTSGNSASASALANNTSGNSATTSALASNTNSNGATTSAVANNTSGNNASTGALANNTSGGSVTTSAVANNTSGNSATTSAVANNTSGNSATTSAVANNTSGNNATTSALANNTSGNSATTSALANNTSGNSASTSALANNTDSNGAATSAVANNTSGGSVTTSAVANNTSGNNASTGALANNTSGNSSTANTSGNTTTTSALANNTSGNSASTSALANNTSGNSATTGALANNTSGNSATTSALANNTSGNSATTSALANNTSGNSASTSAVASNTSGDSSSASALANNTSGNSASTSALANNTDSNGAATSAVANNTSGGSATTSAVANNTSGNNASTGALANTITSGNNASTGALANNTSGNNASTGALANNTSGNSATTSAVASNTSGNSSTANTSGNTTTTSALASNTSNNATSQAGEIHIDGGESGVVSQSGSLLANGGSGAGGSVIIEGQLIHLVDGSHIAATGASAGGSVLIGGGWQGKDSRIKNAEKLVMDSGATIDVSASGQGIGVPVNGQNSGTNIDVAANGQNNSATIDVAAKGQGIGVPANGQSSGATIDVSASGQGIGVPVNGQNSGTNIDVAANGQNNSATIDVAAKGQGIGVPANGQSSGATIIDVAANGQSIGVPANGQGSGVGIDVAANGQNNGVTIDVSASGQGIGVPANGQNIGAALDVSASGQGDGGRVVLWSEGYTSFQGSIKAQGGAAGGNGGRVETSSRGNLQAFGKVDTSAPQGKGGSWLLDPTDVSIVSGTTDTGATADASHIFTPIAVGAQIGVANIEGALNSGSDVIVKTSGGAFEGGQLGNISVQTSIAKISGTKAALTLQADNNISFEPDSLKIQVSGEDTGGLDLNLYVADTGSINFGKFIAIDLKDGDFYAGTAAKKPAKVDLNISNNGHITAGNITLDGSLYGGYISDPGFKKDPENPDKVAPLIPTAAPYFSMKATGNLTINGAVKITTDFKTNSVYSADDKLTINAAGAAITTESTTGNGGGYIELHGGTGGVEINANSLTMTSADTTDANMSRITSDTGITLNVKTIDLTRTKLTAENDLTFTGAKKVTLKDSNLTGVSISATDIANENEDGSNIYAWKQSGTSLIATKGNIIINNKPVRKLVDITHYKGYKLGGGVFEAGNTIEAKAGNIQITFDAQRDNIKESEEYAVNVDGLRISGQNTFTANNINLTGKVKGIRKGAGLSINADTGRVQITATGAVELNATGDMSSSNESQIMGWNPDICGGGTCAVDGIYIHNADISADGKLNISGTALQFPDGFFPEAGTKFRTGYGTIIDGVTLNAAAADIKGRSAGGDAVYPDWRVFNKSFPNSRGFDIKNITWQGGLVSGENITLSSANSGSNAVTNNIGKGGLTLEQYKIVLPKGIENDTYVWLGDILPVPAAEADFAHSYLSTTAKKALWIVKDQNRLNYQGNIAISGLNFDNVKFSNTGDLTLKNGYIKNQSDFTASGAVTLDKAPVTHSTIQGTGITAKNGNTDNASFTATSGDILVENAEILNSTLKAENQITANDVDIQSGKLTTSTGNISFGGSKYVKLRGMIKGNGVDGVEVTAAKNINIDITQVRDAKNGATFAVSNCASLTALGGEDGESTITIRATGNKTTAGDSPVFYAEGADFTAKNIDVDLTASGRVAGAMQIVKKTTSFNGNLTLKASLGNDVLDFDNYSGGIAGTPDFIIIGDAATLNLNGTGENRITATTTKGQAILIKGTVNSKGDLLLDGTSTTGEGLRLNDTASINAIAGGDIAPAPTITLNGSTSTGTGINLNSGKPLSNATVHGFADGASAVAVKIQQALNNVIVTGDATTTPRDISNPDGSSTTISPRSGSGTGVLITGNASLLSSSVTGDSATGFGVNIDSATATLQDSTPELTTQGVQGNNASTITGTVSGTGGTGVRIASSVHGGAKGAADDEIMKIHGIATGDGEGVQLANSITLTNVSLDGTASGSGYAVNVSGSPTLKSGNIDAKNSGSGGAMLISGTSTLDGTNSSSITATIDSAKSAASAVTVAGSATVKNTSITATATQGTAIELNGEDIHITDTDLAGTSTSGTGISTAGGVTLSSSTERTLSGKNSGGLTEADSGISISGTLTSDNNITLSGSSIAPRVTVGSNFFGVRILENATINTAKIEGTSSAMGSDSQSSIGVHLLGNNRLQHVSITGSNENNGAGVQISAAASPNNHLTGSKDTLIKGIAKKDHGIGVKLLTNVEGDAPSGDQPGQIMTIIGEILNAAPGRYTHATGLQVDIAAPVNDSATPPASLINVSLQGLTHNNNDATKIISNLTLSDNSSITGSNDSTSTAQSGNGVLIGSEDSKPFTVTGGTIKGESKEKDGVKLLSKVNLGDESSSVTTNIIGTSGNGTGVSANSNQLVHAHISGTSGNGTGVSLTSLAKLADTTIEGATSGNNTTKAIAVFIGGGAPEHISGNNQITGTAHKNGDITVMQPNNSGIGIQLNTSIKNDSAGTLQITGTTEGNGDGIQLNRDRDNFASSLTGVLAKGYVTGTGGGTAVNITNGATLGANTDIQATDNGTDMEHKGSGIKLNGTVTAKINEGESGEPGKITTAHSEHGDGISVEGDNTSLNNLSLHGTTNSGIGVHFLESGISTLENTQLTGESQGSGSGVVIESSELTITGLVEARKSIKGIASAANSYAIEIKDSNIINEEDPHLLALIGQASGDAVGIHFSASSDEKPNQMTGVAVNSTAQNASAVIIDGGLTLKEAQGEHSSLTANTTSGSGNALVINGTLTGDAQGSDSTPGTRITATANSGTGVLLQKHASLADLSITASSTSNTGAQLSGHNSLNNVTLSGDSQQKTGVLISATADGDPATDNLLTGTNATHITGTTHGTGADAKGVILLTNVDGGTQSFITDGKGDPVLGEDGKPKQNIMTITGRAAGGTDASGILINIARPFTELSKSPTGNGKPLVNVSLGGESDGSGSATLINSNLTLSAQSSISGSNTGTSENGGIGVLIDGGTDPDNSDAPIPITIIGGSISGTSTNKDGVQLADSVDLGDTTPSMPVRTNVTGTSTNGAGVNATGNNHINSTTLTGTSQTQEGILLGDKVELTSSQVDGTSTSGIGVNFTSNNKLEDTTVNGTSQTKDGVLLGSNVNTNGGSLLNGTSTSGIGVNITASNALGYTTVIGTSQTQEGILLGDKVRTLSSNLNGTSTSGIGVKATANNWLQSTTVIGTSQTQEGILLGDSVGAYLSYLSGTSTSGIGVNITANNQFTNTGVVGTSQTGDGVWLGDKVKLTSSMVDGTSTSATAVNITGNDKLTNTDINGTSSSGTAVHLNSTAAPDRDNPLISNTHIKGITNSGTAVLVDGTQTLQGDNYSSIIGTVQQALDEDSQPLTGSDSGTGVKLEVDIHGGAGNKKMLISATTSGKGDAIQLNKTKMTLTNTTLQGTVTGAGGGTGINITSGATLVSTDISGNDNGTTGDGAGIKISGTVQSRLDAGASAGSAIAPISGKSAKGDGISLADLADVQDTALTGSTTDGTGIHFQGNATLHNAPVSGTSNGKGTAIAADGAEASVDAGSIKGGSKLTVTADAGDGEAKAKTFTGTATAAGGTAVRLTNINASGIIINANADQNPATPGSHFSATGAHFTGVNQLTDVQTIGKTDTGTALITEGSLILKDEKSISTLQGIASGDNGIGVQLTGSISGTAQSTVTGKATSGSAVQFTAATANSVSVNGTASSGIGVQFSGSNSLTSSKVNGTSATGYGVRTEAGSTLTADNAQSQITGEITGDSGTAARLSGSLTNVDIKEADGSQHGKDNIGIQLAAADIHSSTLTTSTDKGIALQVVDGKSSFDKASLIQGNGSGDHPTGAIQTTGSGTALVIESAASLDLAEDAVLVSDSTSADGTGVLIKGALTSAGKGAILASTSENGGTAVKVQSGTLDHIFLVAKTTGTTDSDRAVLFSGAGIQVLNSDIAAKASNRPDSIGSGPTAEPVPEYIKGTAQGTAIEFEANAVVDSDAVTVMDGSAEQGIGIILGGNVTGGQINGKSASDVGLSLTDGVILTNGRHSGESAATNKAGAEFAGGSALTNTTIRGLNTNGGTSVLINTGDKKLTMADNSAILGGYDDQTMPNGVGTGIGVSITGNIQGDNRDTATIKGYSNNVEGVKIALAAATETTPQPTTILNSITVEGTSQGNSASSKGIVVSGNIVDGDDIKLTAASLTGNSQSAEGIQFASAATLQDTVVSGTSAKKTGVDIDGKLTNDDTTTITGTVTGEAGSSTSPDDSVGVRVHADVAGGSISGITAAGTAVQLAPAITLSHASIDGKTGINKLGTPDSSADNASSIAVDIQGANTLNNVTLTGDSQSGTGVQISASTDKKHNLLQGNNQTRITGTTHGATGIGVNLLTNVDGCATSGTGEALQIMSITGKAAGGSAGSGLVVNIADPFTPTHKSPNDKDNPIVNVSLNGESDGSGNATLISSNLTLAADSSISGKNTGTGSNSGIGVLIDGGKDEGGEQIAITVTGGSIIGESKGKDGVQLADKANLGGKTVLDDTGNPVTSPLLDTAGKPVTTNVTGTSTDGIGVNATGNNQLTDVSINGTSATKDGVQLGDNVNSTGGSLTGSSTDGIGVNIADNNKLNGTTVNGTSQEKEGVLLGNNVNADGGSLTGKSTSGIGVKATGNNQLKNTTVNGTSDTSDGVQLGNNVNADGGSLTGKSIDGIGVNIADNNKLNGTTVNGTSQAKEGVLLGNNVNADGGSLTGSSTSGIGVRATSNNQLKNITVNGSSQTSDGVWLGDKVNLTLSHVDGISSSAITSGTGVNITSNSTLTDTSVNGTSNGRTHMDNDANGIGVKLDSSTTLVSTDAGNKPITSVHGTTAAGIAVLISGTAAGSEGKIPTLQGDKDSTITGTVQRALDGMSQPIADSDTGIGVKLEADVYGGAAGIKPVKKMQISGTTSGSGDAILIAAKPGNSLTLTNTSLAGTVTDTDSTGGGTAVNISNGVSLVSTDITGKAQGSHPGIGVVVSGTVESSVASGFPKGTTPDPIIGESDTGAGISVEDNAEVKDTALQGTSGGDATNGSGVLFQGNATLNNAPVTGTSTGEGTGVKTSGGTLQITGTDEQHKTIKGIASAEDGLAILVNNTHIENMDTAVAKLEGIATGEADGVTFDGSNKLTGITTIATAESGTAVLNHHGELILADEHADGEEKRHSTIKGTVSPGHSGDAVVLASNVTGTDANSTITGEADSGVAVAVAKDVTLANLQVDGSSNSNIGVALEGHNTLNNVTVTGDSQQNTGVKISASDNADENLLSGTKDTHITGTTHGTGANAKGVELLTNVNGGATDFARDGDGNVIMVNGKPKQLVIMQITGNAEGGTDATGLLVNISKPFAEPEKPLVNVSLGGNANGSGDAVQINSNLSASPITADTDIKTNTITGTNTGTGNGVVINGKDSPITVNTAGGSIVGSSVSADGVQLADQASLTSSQVNGTSSSGTGVNAMGNNQLTNTDIDGTSSSGTAVHLVSSAPLASLDPLVSTMPMTNTHINGTSNSGTAVLVEGTQTLQGDKDSSISGTVQQALDEEDKPLTGSDSGTGVVLAVDIHGGAAGVSPVKKMQISATTSGSGDAIQLKKADMQLTNTTLQGEVTGTGGGTAVNITQGATLVSSDVTGNDHGSSGDGSGIALNGTISATKGGKINPAHSDKGDAIKVFAGTSVSGNPLEGSTVDGTGVHFLGDATLDVNVTGASTGNGTGVATGSGKLTMNGTESDRSITGSAQGGAGTHGIGVVVDSTNLDNVQQISGEATSEDGNGVGVLLKGTVTGADTGTEVIGTSRTTAANDDPASGVQFDSASTTNLHVQGTGTGSASGVQFSGDNQLTTTVVNGTANTGIGVQTNAGSTLAADNNSSPITAKTTGDTGTAARLSGTLNKVKLSVSTDPDSKTGAGNTGIQLAAATINSSVLSTSTTDGKALQVVDGKSTLDQNSTVSTGTSGSAGSGRGLLVTQGAELDLQKPSAVTMQNTGSGTGVELAAGSTLTLAAGETLISNADNAAGTGALIAGTLQGGTLQSSHPGGSATAPAEGGGVAIKVQDATLKNTKLDASSAGGNANDRAVYFADSLGKETSSKLIESEVVATIHGAGSAIETAQGAQVNLCSAEDCTAENNKMSTMQGTADGNSGGVGATIGGTVIGGKINGESDSNVGLLLADNVDMMHGRHSGKSAATDKAGAEFKGNSTLVNTTISGLNTGGAPSVLIDTQAGSMRLDSDSAVQGGYDKDGNPDPAASGIGVSIAGTIIGTSKDSSTSPATAKPGTIDGHSTGDDGVQIVAASTLDNVKVDGTTEAADKPLHGGDKETKSGVNITATTTLNGGTLITGHNDTAGSTGSAVHIGANVQSDETFDPFADPLPSADECVTNCIKGETTTESVGGILLDKNSQVSNLQLIASAVDRAGLQDESSPIILFTNSLVKGSSVTEDGVNLANPATLDHTRVYGISKAPTAENKAGVHLAAGDNQLDSSTVQGTNTGTGEAGAGVIVEGNLIGTGTSTSTVTGSTSSTDPDSHTTSGSADGILFKGSKVDQVDMQADSTAGDGINFTQKVEIKDSRTEGKTTATDPGKSGIHFADDVTLEGKTDISGTNTGTNPEKGEDDKQIAAGAGITFDKNLSGSGKDTSTVKGSNIAKDEKGNTIDSGNGDAIVFKGDKASDVSMQAQSAAGDGIVFNGGEVDHVAMEAESAEGEGITFTHEVAIGDSTVKGKTDSPDAGNSGVHFKEITTFENTTAEGTNTGKGAAVTFDKSLSGNGSETSKVIASNIVKDDQGKTIDSGTGDAIVYKGEKASNVGMQAQSAEGNGIVFDGGEVDHVAMEAESAEGEGMVFPNEVKIVDSIVKGKTASPDAGNSGIHFKEITTFENTTAEGINTGKGAAVTFDKSLSGNGSENSKVIASNIVKDADGKTIDSGTGDAIVYKGDNLANVAMQADSAEGNGMVVTQQVNISDTKLQVKTAATEPDKTAILFSEDTVMERTNVVATNTGAGAGATVAKNLDGSGSSSLQAEADKGDGLVIHSQQIDNLTELDGKSKQGDGILVTSEVTINNTPVTGSTDSAQPDKAGVHFKELTTEQNGTTVTGTNHSGGEKVIYDKTRDGGTGGNPGGGTGGGTGGGSGGGTGSGTGGGTGGTGGGTGGNPGGGTGGNPGGNPGDNPGGGTIIDDTGGIADSGIQWYVDYLKAMLEKNSNDLGIMSNQWETNNHFRDKSDTVELRICTGISGESCYSIFMDNHHPIWKVVRQEP